MKAKITNKTGMRLRYANIKFEPNETKILELESTYEHEYFLVEKIEKKSKNNQKSLKSEKRIKSTMEVKQDGISRRMD